VFEINGIIDIETAKELEADELKDLGLNIGEKKMFLKTLKQYNP